jgi:hypothetical protein
MAIVTAVATGAISSVAWGDAGPPGTTFPEQPGSHPATACSAVASNPGTGFGGAFSQNASPTAIGIVGGLYADACLGR